MINILLASYNSEKFLRNQLDSILAQDQTDFQLLIRDGGSVDSTLSIIKEYAGKDRRIRFLGTGKASAKENFGKLLAAADGELIMFSDHDDVWMPDKISVTLSAYRQAEEENPSGMPLLVFTDAQVVDVQCKCIHPSLLRFQNLDPEKTMFRQLLLQNIPPGNTMLFNKALLDLIRPLPKEIVMHDAWVALTAAAFGKIVFLNKATLYYRQHEDNVYGAFRYSLSFFIKKLLMGHKKIKSRFYENVRQGKTFLEHYRPNLSSEPLAMLEDFAILEHCNFWKKRWILIKYGIYKNGFLRNAGMFAMI